VIADLSFHIHQGEFIALVGPNGSGKTTVLKLILGLERPDSGTIEIFGGTSNKGEAQNNLQINKIGYVPQRTAFDESFPICVEDMVKMGRIHSLSRKYGAEDKLAVKDAMEQVEIVDLSKMPYAALSGGQRRRVLVARALASRPSLLILDEPTANMDAESEDRLYETLGKLKGNTTVLIVTHDKDFVSNLIDRVLCMGEGGIVQHGLDEEGNASRILHNESAPGDACL
jgi:zinc transport system ATP-binding protein